jgi:HK97 family phage major capsid protein
MMEGFLPSARGVWVMNQTVMSNLFQMTVGTSNVWQPNMQQGVPGNLFGMPVIFTEKLPTVGNAGDVLLADWRYYLIGDRQATTIESTQFYQWQYDLTSWRAVHRVDGQPWLSAPLTLSDGTVQVSPFVILGAKST